MYGLPREVVLASEIRGHAEQTEEKTIARPHLGDLTKLGDETIIWTYFVLNRAKIIDELSRFPGSKLNLFVDGIDRGNWKYLSGMIRTGDFPLFATCNWADRSNQALTEVIVERFDIATESMSPSVTQRSRISEMDNGAHKLLENAVVANQIFGIYNAKGKSYQEKMQEVKVIIEQFKWKLGEGLGIQLLGYEELKKAEEEIKDIRINDDAELYFIFADTELSTCQHRLGVKRKNDKCFSNECHWSDFACQNIKNPLSARTLKAWKKYARALAWYTGADEVNIEHMYKVLPYVTWHKAEMQSSYLTGLEKDQQAMVLNLYAMQKLAKGISDRFRDQAAFVKNYVCFRKQGLISKAAEYASDKNHPIFPELERDTRLEALDQGQSE